MRLRRNDIAFGSDIVLPHSDIVLADSDIVLADSDIARKHGLRKI